MPSTQYSDELLISRCFALARNGIGRVSPNPPVGAVLVHNNEIIGEGFHVQYGQAHAEVEAINNVSRDKRHLIPLSTLYVSLEPCCIYGKTPPCTDLIIRVGIKDVRISVTDPNPLVAGNGIQILEKNNIHVKVGILPEEGNRLIRAFKTNIIHKRPHIILKWAQSKHGFIGEKDNRILISHPHTATWSHQLRASADAIVVGARTVRIDNPYLTTRAYPGDSPARIVYDPSGTLDESYHVFANDGKAVYYFSEKENPNILLSHINKQTFQPTEHIPQILSTLFQNKIGIVLVEGGTYLINKFIEANLWDEAWVIKSNHDLNRGIQAPSVKGKLIDEFSSATDTVVGIQNENVN